MSENKNAIKNINIIRDYWDKTPCNVNHSKLEKDSKEYFDEVENKKHFVEPHILEFADFSNTDGMKVLEIGCGIGTAAINFIRNGAHYTGIELSNESLKLTEKRLSLENKSCQLYNLDAESNLDFIGLESFDLIYSFGVIHHSPNPEKIVKNVYKLLKPNGTFKLMLYAKHSWKQMLIDNNVEQYEAQNNCPLAYTYTRDDVYKLLSDFINIDIKQTHIFQYKINEYKNNVYEKEDWFKMMPEYLLNILEENLGWHLCIRCKKKH